MYYASVPLFIFCFTLLASFPAYAATDVTSDITTDTVWTTAGSPYIIRARVTILERTTLTIEPGVIVKFDTTQTYLMAKGTLNALGTSAHPTYFTSIRDDSIGGDTNGDGDATTPQPRDWFAIYISGGTGSFDHVVITYAGGGACDICQGAGIFSSSGRLNMRNSHVAHNGRYGLRLLSGEATISYTKIHNHLYGIEVFSGVYIFDVVQNSIHDNTLYGVWFSPSKNRLFLKATDNYWGDVSGPYNASTNPTGAGNPVSNSVLFDPWLTEDPTGGTSPPPVAECCSSVVFIPGLQATRLEYENNRLWEPNSTSDTPRLFFDIFGEPIIKNVTTGGVIDEAFGFNIYKSFIEFMETDLVDTGIINEWMIFPYDWRFSIEDAARKGILIENLKAYWMANELQRLAASSQTGKVSIVAHSNGGLVAKELISFLEEEGYAHIIDKLILVASPQLGTPKALAGLLHGDEQTIPSKIGILVAKESARGLAENMPSAFTLLPSEKYFSEVFDPVIEFDPDVASIYDFPALYGNSVDSRIELDAFLLGDNGVRTEPNSFNTDEPNVIGENLLRKATSTQAKLDAWMPPPGITVTQIAGWGLDTIRGIRYDDCDVPLCPDELSNLDRELVLVHDGDGTVVIPSATAMDTETYYVNLKRHNRVGGAQRNRDHADVLEIEELQMFIRNLLHGEIIFTDLIKEDKPLVEDDEKKLRFRIHSPVSLDLYDADGNHTGLIENPNLNGLQGIEQEISNSYYLEFGEIKYAGVDTFATTTVILTGLDTGTFTFEIDEVLGDAVVASTTFADIPVVEGALVTSDVQHAASSTVLSIDMDGDGEVDAVIEPGEGISIEELIGILRGMVRSLDLADKKEKKLLKNIDKLEKILNKEFKNEKKEKMKTDKAFLKLEQLIEKFGKKRMLSTEDTQELMHIIEQIKGGVVG